MMILLMKECDQQDLTLPEVDHKLVLLMEAEGKIEVDLVTMMMTWV